MMTTITTPKRISAGGPGVRLFGRFFMHIVFCLATAFAAAVHAQNYSDIWWNPSEAGWGLSLVDHSTHLAGVWYTYTPAGTPIWYVMPAAPFTQGKRFATLDIYQATGPAYNVAFNPSQVVQSKVGTATFDFAPPGLAAGIVTFSYNMGSVSQTKQVQRTPFGDAAPVWGTDLTDILWNASEAGWGLALVQHGNSIGGVWYTYGTDGQPLWVIMPAVSFTTPTSFSGPLYTATGPSFSSAQFDPSQVHLTQAGDASISFTQTGSKIFNERKQFGPGNFVPRLNNFSQFKAITFVPFATARADAPAPGETPLAIAVAPPGLFQVFGGVAIDPPIRVVTASGGTPPYHFQLDSLGYGAPPIGTGVNLDGFLTGRPALAANITQYAFSVCVSDIGGHSKCLHENSALKSAALVVVEVKSAIAGTYHGTFSGPCARGTESSTCFGDVIFSVNDAATLVTVTEPLDGSATLAQSGNFSVSGGGAGNLIGLSCGFGGNISVSASGVASGSGTYNCSGTVVGESATASGNWSATHN